MNMSIETSCAARHRWVAWLAATILGASVLGASAPSDARRRRSTRRPAASTTAVTDRAVSGETPAGGRRPVAELLGKFKWQMSPDEVIALLSAELQERYRPQVEAAAGDAIKQDQLRKQLRDEVEQLRRSYVSFNGPATGWDVSIVDQEFVHKNFESMVVHWQEGHKRRMFFFFVDQQLWKVFVAFSNNNSALEGKSYEQFVSLLEARYGAAAPKFRESMRGEAKLDYIEWTPSGRELLQSIDHTALYGNYCLRVIDTRTNGWIGERRKRNSPAIQRRDTIVDAATKKPAIEGDPNENIVDRITGRRPTGGPRLTPANPTIAPAPAPAPSSNDGDPSGSGRNGTPKPGSKRALDGLNL
jgi:hypothetical protein